MKKVQIHRKSVFDNFTVKSSGNNWSAIFDKLVRLAAKVTESYAGDILIWTHSMLFEEDQPKKAAFLFCFRESGVEKIDCSCIPELETVLNGRTVEVSEPTELRMSLVSSQANHLQQWLLYCKEDGSATLIRVSIDVCGGV